MQNSHDDFNEVGSSPPTVNGNLNEQLNCPETIEAIAPYAMAYNNPSETENTDTEYSVRRGSRRRIPNSKYTKDYISPTISPNLLRKALSPKRYLSSSTDNVSDCASKNQNHTQRKKAKVVSPNPIKRKQIPLNNQSNIMVVDNLNLKWPRYGIREQVFAGETYSVIQTCSVDTGLFAMYHAYKARSNTFRELFEDELVDSVVTLREVFKRVEQDGWDVARLYWLVRHNLLTLENFDGKYNMENTLTNAVFQFVKPMQEFDVRSECMCTVCPKRIKKRPSVDITLR